MPPLSELLAPIAGDNPAGKPLRDEKVYAEIEEARREDPDLPQGEWQTARKVADWKLVAKLSTEALKQSKDLQIAVWLTEALLKTQRFAGLRDGLDLICGLLEQYWDQLYPEMEDDDPWMRIVPLERLALKFNVPVLLSPITADGYNLLQYRESRTIPTEAETEWDTDKKEQRQRAIEQERLLPETFDKSFEQTPKDWYRQLVADLDGALASLERLDEIGLEKFGDEAPHYRDLRSALTEVRQIANQLLNKKLEADPDPAGATGSSADAPVLVAELVDTAPAPAVGGRPVTAAGAASGSGAIPSLSGAISATPRDRDDAAARIAGVARFLRGDSPTDPGPYLMLRGLRWGELRASGVEVDPRLLAAPPTEIRTRLKSLLLDGDWEALLETAEEVMATPFGRGWLDLQRYVLTACAGLGGEYDRVADAIRGALRSLLQELPQLPEMTMMDDTATANAETRNWLRAEGLSGEPVEAPSEEEEAPGVRPRPIRDPFQWALARAQAGEPTRGIELLMREAEQETSPRGRFLRRSQAARVMVDAGLDAVATPILRELSELIQKHQLEAWEGGTTVAEPLGLLYRCLEKSGEDPAAQHELYVRICRLDPLQAIQYADLSGSTSTEAGGEFESSADSDGWSDESPETTEESSSW